MASELAVLKATFLSTVLDHAAIKWAIGISMGVLGFLFPTEGLMRCGAGVLALIVVDWFTALSMVVLKRRKFSSQKARKGGIKLVGYGIHVLVVAVAAYTVPELKGAHTFFLSILLGHIAWTEVVSICENLSKMGAPMPEPVLQALKTYRAKREARERESDVVPAEDPKL